MADRILGHPCRVPVLYVQREDVSSDADQSLLRLSDVRLLRNGKDNSEARLVRLSRAHRPDGFDLGFLRVARLD